MRGRNHYSEDIEATVQRITRGRVAAIAVSDEQTEKLVAIIELKDREDTEGLTLVKSDVIAAISRAHGLAGGRHRPGGARVDPDHHKRQDPPGGVRGAAPAGAVRPVGRVTDPLRARPAQRGLWLSTYCAPARSCEIGSAPPPKAAWVAGAVTAAGS